MLMMPQDRCGIIVTDESPIQLGVAEGLHSGTSLVGRIVFAEGRTRTEKRSCPISHVWILPHRYMKDNMLRTWRNPVEFRSRYWSADGHQFRHNGPHVWRLQKSY